MKSLFLNGYPNRHVNDNGQLTMKRLICHHVFSDTARTAEK